MKNYSALSNNSRIILLALICTLYGCAQIMAPTGGARDTDPPKVISCEPQAGSLNYTGKKIKINFNEYIKVKDAGSWLISPPQKLLPEYAIKGKTLEIELQDSLKKNTTYSISFGNSISDFTEGNPMPSFSYVFSTGTFTDSLFINGIAVSANTGKAEKDISILIYKAEKTKTDSFLIKLEPDYYAPADEQGMFNAGHLPEGDFFVAAIGDKNKNYKFDPPDEWIGYGEKPISSIDSVAKISPEIRYYKVPAPQYLKKSDNNKPSTFIGIFNRSYVNPFYQIPTNPDSLFIIWGKNKDSISVWDLSFRRDSLMMLIFEEGNKSADTLNIKFKKSVPAKENTVKANPGKLKFLPVSFPNGTTKLKRKIGDPIQLVWRNPIKSINSALMEVYLNKEKIPVIWTQDKIDLRLISPSIPSPFPDSALKFVLLPGAVSDYFSTLADTVVLECVTIPESEFGNLNLNINGIKGSSFIIELINDENQTVKRQVSFLPASLSYAYLDPGNYRLKLTEDKNGNQRWDEGDPIKLTQPEKILFPDKRFEIRANWDLEEEITVDD